MYNQFFGQFLLQKGLLTAEQLCRAFQAESAVRVKLGVLAVDRGWMTAAQAQEINEMQKAADKRFGDLAIAKNYLTEDQVTELLQSQRSGHLSLSQAIIDQGFLSLAELTPVLELYKRESGPGRAEDEYDALAGRCLELAGAGQTDTLYVDYIGLFLRNMVRSLQVTPVLERAEKFDGSVQGRFISQTLQLQDCNLLTGMALSDATVVQLASLYSKESLNAADELALDAAAEFLNLHNGLFSINLGNSGVEALMLPQQVEQSPEFTVRQGYAVSIVIPFGRLHLIIAQVE